jgi:hypothetical protein
MINNAASATITIVGNSYVVNTISGNMGIGSMFPSLSLTLGHEDFVLINETFDGYTQYSYPPVSVQVFIDNNLRQSFNGVITQVNATEAETGLTNTVTVMPISFIGSIKTTTFDGTDNQAYLSDSIQLCNDIITAFNTNVFAALNLPVIPQLLPIIMPQTYKQLLIAPRFINMTLTEMLEMIVGAYGYTLLFTWDNQVIAGSINDPIRSDVPLIKDNLKENSFSNDVLLEVASSKLGW